MAMGDRARVTCVGFVAVCIFAMAPSLRAQAQPPAAINIHGQLLDSTGDPITGTRAYQITFFDAATNGTMLGSTVTGLTTVSGNGLFNIAITPPAAVLGESSVWYELGVDTDTPIDNDASDDLFPNRVQVLSVPFALLAGEANSVDAGGVGSGSVDNAELEALDGIAGNVQTQLDDKAAASEVYSQSAADDAFVDESGDSMSGPLGVDAVNESTADAGVSVEGVLHQDNTVRLPETAAPADTTGKLYNVGGNVFFNGTQLDNGSGSNGTRVLFGEIMGSVDTGETLAEIARFNNLFDGIFVREDLIANNGPFFGGVVPQRRSYTIESLFLFYHERDPWADGDATLTVTFEINNAAGAQQHALFTTEDLQGSFSQLQWVDLSSSLPADAADRTVETSEHLAFTIETTQNDNLGNNGSFFLLLLEVTDN